MSVTLLLALFSPTALPVQDRLATMPRFAEYTKARADIQGSVQRGDASLVWQEDALYARANGKIIKINLKNYVRSEVTEIPSTNSQGERGQGQRRGFPERGRQFDRTFSPDGKTMALYKDRNVWLADAEGKNPVAVTTAGSESARTKYGQASWVYGEELNVREAMWFSPDGKNLAYYGFDESKVKDYYLTLGQNAFQSTLDVEAYPKAGSDNPKVELLVFNIESKKEVHIDTSFGDASIGEYVYDVRWSPDGTELLYNRTNRKQNIMQFCAADPATGKSRVIVEEKWLSGWVENSPSIRYLADNKTFVWVSERNGFRNFYLGHLDGRALTPITQHKFEVINIVRIDETKRTFYYTARSGDTQYKAQLHRCRIDDGDYDVRLTDPAFHHTVVMPPKAEIFVDTYETVSIPPRTALRDSRGRQMHELATSDDTKFKAAKLQTIEQFKFKAADGITDLYGYISKPSDFDPKVKYPLMVDVYGGPDSGGSFERFRLPDPETGFGVITAWFEGRGTNGRGKAFKDAVYGKLGVVEIDDQAAGVKFLTKRPYIDATKVGINGTSYGGYASAMAILRHPNVFQVAIASSSVTDWRHYDTIYTERYMGLPWENENKKGYDEGSAMTYANQLKGRLLLFYGTADNNVHPSNTLMLSTALNRANKSYDMMVGADIGHAGVGFARTWEYFFISTKIAK